MSKAPESAIEVCARFSIHRGKLDKFEEAVAACVERVRANEPGALRYDWFLDANSMEAVAMDVYRSPAALLEHLGNLRQHFPKILACASASIAFLGNPGADILEVTRPMGTKCFDFFGGLLNYPAARNFTNHTQVLSNASQDHIEIITDFSVAAGKWKRFCELSQLHIDVVSEKDSGTLRYDWFMDEDSLQCITLDTYQNTEGMFEHMRHCRDIHGEYKQLATLSTLFLGELPVDAAAAVAKYQPQVLPFFMGLKAYSSGGFG